MRQRSRMFEQPAGLGGAATRASMYRANRLRGSHQFKVTTTKNVAFNKQ
jgi:hypothetical protein